MQVSDIRSVVATEDALVFDPIVSPYQLARLLKGSLWEPKG